MSATVPSRAVDLAVDGVVSGAVPRGNSWVSIARAYNALDGMPTALIPMFVPQMSMPGNGIDLADPAIYWHFTTWPRYQTTHRLWMFSAETLAGTGQGKFTDPSGGSTYFGFNESSGDVLVTHVEEITSRTSAESRLYTTFESSTDGMLMSFACYELPRPSLAVGGSSLATTDAGLEETVLRSGMVIADDYNGVGVGFVASKLDELRDSCRRPGLFAMAPYASSTSSTFAYVMQQQLYATGVSGPTVLGRTLYNGIATSTMQLAFEVVGGAGTTGEIRVTMNSGATRTFGFGATTTVRGEIPIDAENLSASDGRRSSRSDTIAIELRRVSGGGTVQLLTATGGEAAPAVASSAATASTFAIRKPLRLPPEFLFGRKSR